MTFHNSALARLVPDGNYRSDDRTRVEAALYCHRFDDIISGAVDPQDVANRPHVRFDGRTLSEIGDQRSAHAQNDALVRYFAAIRFWQDEDSGSERMRR